MNIRRAVRKGMERMAGPAAAVLINAAVVAVMIHRVVFHEPQAGRVIEVQVVASSEIPEPEPPQPRPDELPRDDSMQASDELQSAAPESSRDELAADAPDLTGLAVSPVQSPLVMQGLFAGRTESARAGLLKKFAGGYGNQIEAAVLRALEWLASQQNPDGSWGPAAPSGRSRQSRPWVSSMGNEQRATRLTALCLLAFLGHGETPQSAKFGRTVQSALEYLLAQQNPQTGLFVPLSDNRPEKSGDDLGVYAHAQAVYALAEAYALTQAPLLRRPVERGLQVIINGQLGTGSWGNWYEQNISDSSAASWQIQALKAAEAAGIRTAGQAEALRRAADGIRYLYKGEGVWYYRKGDVLALPREGGPIMSGAMVLSLQLLGLQNDPMVTAGLRYLSDFGVTEWSKAWENPINKSLPATYEWYYNTQAVFQRGGSRWAAWNSAFAPMLLAQQNPEGWWLGIGQRSDEEKIYSTSLCALSLQVYYRILPAARQPAASAPQVVFDDDVMITIF
jgi:hypothetical protein